MFDACPSGRDCQDHRGTLKAPGRPMTRRLTDCVAGEKTLDGNRKSRLVAKGSQTERDARRKGPEMQAGLAFMLLSERESDRAIPGFA